MSKRIWWSRRSAWVLGEAGGEMSGTSCWTAPAAGQRPCHWTLFHDSTGLDAYPEALQPAVRDGVLQYACNSEIRYRFRGIRVRQRAEWRQREPEGTGDLHRLTMRGSRCEVRLRQDEETGYHADAVAPSERLASRWNPSCLGCLPSGRSTSPGWRATPASLGVRLLLPPALEQGHESHFALALNAFLDHLDRGTWPEALRARMRMRYTLLARARDLALREGAAAQGPTCGPQHFV